MNWLNRWCSLLGVCAIAVVAALPCRAETDDAPFEAFADELIATIGRNAVASTALPNNATIQGMLFKAGLGKISVAVWPFRAEELPVSKTTADRWNEKLVAALVRKKPTHMHLMTRQHLKTLLLETQSIKAFEEVVNPTETLARNAAVNFLIIGEVRAATGGIELAYKGVNVNTGELVASTDHRLFALDLGEAEEREKALPLTAAITQAAQAIAGRDLGIETLKIYGLREEPSKQVAPFSDYFTSRLAAEIEKKLSASQLDFRLKVEDATFNETSLKTRGIPVTAGADADARAGFTLGGSYWVFPNHIDVNLAIQNGLGERVTWTGRIGRASIPAELLSPPNAQIAAAPQDDVGPIGLELSTNKGRNPRFRFGETMVLMVEVQRDAHLNCYYRQADGTAFRFFPNRHVTGGNRVKAGTVNKLPGAGMPFSFTMAPPEGAETVHCFATDQAVADKLPRSLVGNDLEPIPPADYRKLSAAFRSIPGLRLSEASMTVTVRN